MKKKQQSEIKNKKEMQIPLETAQAVELNSTKECFTGWKTLFFFVYKIDIF